MMKERERRRDLFLDFYLSTIIFEKMDGGELLASKCVAENLRQRYDIHLRTC